MPSVPDVTILDELPKPQSSQTSNPNEPVFSESYKQMLISSHEQFMKQIQQEKSPSVEQTSQASQPKKKSALFNPPTNKYQENPLRKYAPNPPPPRAFDNDPYGPHDSSSILIEVERPAASCSASTSDEKTVKKVADMLNQIEKLAIPEQTKPDKSGEKTTAKNSEPPEIMRNLASNYLSSEEREFYEVEKELEELQVQESDDDSEDM